MSILVVAIKKLQQQRVFVTKKELSFAKQTEAFTTSVQPPLPLKKNRRRGPSPNFSELRGRLNTGQNLHDLPS